MPVPPSYEIIKNIFDKKDVDPRYKEAFNIIYLSQSVIVDSYKEPLEDLIWAVSFLHGIEWLVQRTKSSNQSHYLYKKWQSINNKSLFDKPPRFVARTHKEVLKQEYHIYVRCVEWIKK